MYIIVWIIRLYYNRLSSSLLTASHGPSAVTRLFSRTQFRSSVSSHGPNSVALSLLTGPVPLPVSSHGPSSVARLFSRTQYRCSISSHGHSSFSLSLLTDPVPLHVSYHGPSSVSLALLTQPFPLPISLSRAAALRLPTDPARLSRLMFQTQFRCSVRCHGPSSVPRALVRLIPSCLIGPSTAFPRYTNELVCHRSVDVPWHQHECVWLLVVATWQFPFYSLRHIIKI